MSKKVYFVTGANKGIGLEFVKRLAQDSSNIVIGSTRDESRSSDLIHLAENSSNVKIVKLDVGDQSSIDKLPSQLTEVAPDGIDVFISNAGIYDDDILHKVLETERSAWLRHFEVNSLGVIFVLKAILPFLEKKATKQVILISSIAGQISDLFPLESYGYNTSKVALNYIGRSLSGELKEYTVVAVHPGIVSTDSLTNAFRIAIEKNPEAQLYLDSVTVITPQESAESVIKLIKNFTPSDDDKFYSYDGSILTW